MVNGTAAETPPPGELLTACICAVPGEASKLDGIAAYISLLLTTVVNSAWPFQLAVALHKLFPLISTYMLKSPADADDGLTEVIAGTPGPTTLNGIVLEVPPPSPGLTTPSACTVPTP